MKTFMLLCFLMLGLAFYQLSGGADFEPERREVAELETQAAPEVTGLQASEELALIRPQMQTAEEGTIQDRLSRALVTPDVVAVSLEATEGAVSLEVTEDTAETVEVATAETLEAAPIREQLAVDLRQVGGSRVTMRNGPGTTFAVLITLNSGTTAEVIESNDDGWVRVRVRDTGQEGWMAERLLVSVNG